VKDLLILNQYFNPDIPVLGASNELIGCANSWRG